MSREPDVDEASDLVAAINALLDGRRYRVALSALGVVLTEFAAAHDVKERERVLRVILEGVRRDMPKAEGQMMLIDGAIVWH